MTSPQNYFVCSFCLRLHRFNLNSIQHVKIYPKPHNFYTHVLYVFLFAKFQAIGKMFHIRYADEYLWSLNFIQKLYNVHAKTESHDRAKYFRKFAMCTEFLLKFFTCVVLLALLLPFLVPIYIYVMENKLVPVCPFYLPGIDENTTAGYIILLTFHLTACCIGIVGYAAFEFLLDTVVISSLIFGKLIATDTGLISNDLDNEKRRDAIYRLRNVFLMHQEMCE